MFFSYGRLLDLLFDLGWHLGPLVIGRHLVLLPLSLITVGVGSFLVWRTEHGFEIVMRFLNVTGAVLLLFSLVPIGVHTAEIISDMRTGTAQSTTTTTNLNNESLPDIYYIILDGYANAKTLKEFYSYDNSNFLNSLRKRGFYVAGESRSNYPLTVLSLASSLNMKHLNNLKEDPEIKQGSLAPVFRMMEHNEVVRFLKSKGYRYVHFGSGWDATNDNKEADILIRSRGLDNFSMLLLNTTMMRPIVKRYIVNDVRNHILSTFNSLENAPSIRGPKFVFAHILTPHPPYVFNRSGGKAAIGDMSMDVFGKTSWLPREAYLEQLIYANSKVQSLVDALILKSKVKPIIVIQSDHGPIVVGGHGDSSAGPADYLYSPEYIRGKAFIFNAYYLPKGGSKKLYDSITPVNSFRVIFNYYFDADLPMLEDRIYYSTYDNLIGFREVTNEVAD